MIYLESKGVFHLMSALSSYISEIQIYSLTQTVNATILLLILTIYISGFEPVEYFAEDESASMGVSDGLIMQSWNRSSLRQMIWSEPYLVFAVFFLCLRVLISIFPDVLSHLKAFWDSYVPHLNLEIFGETSQIFGRALHMIDVRRVLTRLRLCKTRNFHEGAKNARVWASLASVSLGEPSSSR